MSRVDLSAAIAAGIVTADEAEAIKHAVVDHGDALELRRENLTDDQLEALDRAVIWLQDQERLVTEACSGR